MQMLDAEILKSRAVVIDGNATARSVLAAQLRELGLQEVRQLARVQDARMLLEREAYDIVLCEMDFDGAPMSGQDLLDELRREQLLPAATAFVLLTANASYARVVEAAQANADGFLVKPCSASALAERLAEVRRRKRELAPLYQAMRGGDAAGAAALAEQRFAARAPYWRYAAQAAAELWLRAGRPERAQALCEAVLEEAPQAWARLGIARAHLARGELGAARRQLEACVAKEGGDADAHELLARTLVELGEFEPALQAMRSASSLTPGCLLRRQHRGALAFYLGQKEEAASELRDAIAMGRKSRLFEPSSLLLLALLEHDARQARNFAALAEQVSALAAADADAGGDSPRLRRIHELVRALGALQARRHEAALQAARALAEEADRADFDLEAAVITLALWVRLPAAAVDAAELAAVVQALALRFGVSKAATETLLGALDARPELLERVREGHAEIGRVAEQALGAAMKGHADAALQLLLQQGERTRNAKLIEMSLTLARRHADQVNDAPALTQRAQALQARCGAPISQLAGVARAARVPGGLALRG
ncbi:MAG: hypothetical protein AMXMBFR78_36790 [Rubrivivax sp.]